MPFPEIRLRRLRRTESLRALVRETTLNPGDLIYPLFICPGEGVRNPISSMPGVFNLSVDQAVREAEEASSLGIGGLLLFGLPDSKDEKATGAWDDNGIVQRALRALKQSSAAKKLVLMADVCLCEYTSHGHCGVVLQSGDNYEIDNDPSLELLAKTAASLARAGADIIAPSDMMDGRVAAIRRALDAEGNANTPILSYASKFASAFYGPFREAVNSSLQGDRAAYQQDASRSVADALAEVAMDVQEGADLVMVKPALPYLDILRAVADASPVPVAAYQISGEYAMVEAAAANGWLNRERAMLETLTSIKRAGASVILTYWATEVANLLR